MPKPKPTDQQIRAARIHLGQRLSCFPGSYEVHQVLRVGAGSRPHVAIVIRDGERCVIKDHAGCDPWFARWIGPLLARREARALERLQGVEGIPRFLGRLDARALLMSHVDAGPYRRADRSPAEWAAFFARMETLVADMHGRGVAHCDLRSPDNTLIDAAGAPAVVDFVASYRRGARWNPWTRWLFARFTVVDRSAIEKQKRTVAPELSAAAAANETVLGRSARRLGVAVRRLARLFFTRS